MHGQAYLPQATLGSHEGRPAAYQCSATSSSAGTERRRISGQLLRPDPSEERETRYDDVVPLSRETSAMCRAGMTSGKGVKKKRKSNVQKRSGRVGIAWNEERRTLPSRVAYYNHVRSGHRRTVCAQIESDKASQFIDRPNRSISAKRRIAQSTLLEHLLIPSVVGSSTIPFRQMSGSMPGAICLLIYRVRCRSIGVQSLGSTTDGGAQRRVRVSVLLR